ncbi:unnamed protein product [Trichogramma brassicae]|uniref:BZIP domain-containing protein n=1 Tax=Trichogramma brassicae TaxID=86971 RepID=A0A6H5IMA8_9HYME|nr:unnamed protein product [Trichogramma brassicae]
MYNLNCLNLNGNGENGENGEAASQQTPSLLSVAMGMTAAGAAEVTPRTPEIVNSLISMTTNPFDTFGQAINNNNNGGGATQSPLVGNCVNGSRFGNVITNAGRVRHYSTSSGEPSPPSVQHTRSQLIKEGLKLTLQTKRRANGNIMPIQEEMVKQPRLKREEGSADDEDDDESSNSKTTNELTPEDEERRRKRRERNKIAATKCRLKKRQKTTNLVQESECLTSQNQHLKKEIQQLSTEREELIKMLGEHNCTRGKNASPSHNSMYAQQQQQQQYGTESLRHQQLPAYQDNFAAAPTNHPHHQQQQQNNDYTQLVQVDYVQSVKVEDYDVVNQNYFVQENNDSTNGNCPVSQLSKFNRTS